MIPRLVPDLETALHILYEQSSNNHHGILKEAHEFLMFFQSRNPRRKVVAFRQSCIDHKDAVASDLHCGDNSRKKKNDDISLLKEVGLGSTWLACMYILCLQEEQGIDTNEAQRPATRYSGTEKLFAAQTLLHRVRRTKLLEAIDLEFERDREITPEQALVFTEHAHHVLQPFIQWVPNSFIKEILQQAQYSRDDESLSKGQVSLLTLICVLFVSAQNDSSSYPLLATIASTAVTIALRMVYSPITLLNKTDDQLSLTGLLLDSIHSVHSMAGSHVEVLSAVLHLCWASIPEVILGSPGGCQGRLSMNPNCLHAATNELRTEGVQKLAFSLDEILKSQHGELWVLRTCELWGKYVLFPEPLLRQTVWLASKHLDSRNRDYRVAAFRFIIAIFEAGSWSIDQVLKTSLGMTDENRSAPAGKKKPSSRSKKRHKESLERKKSAEGVREDLDREVFARGQNACVSLELVWDNLRRTVEESLSPCGSVDGEGSIGCFVTAVNAYFSFSIRSRRWSDLLRELSCTFCQLCRYPNPSVRSMCYETLFSMHSVLIATRNENDPLSGDLESFVEALYVDCALGLAQQCAYPKNYFVDMTLESIHDLEVERNDIRDIIRCLTYSFDLASTSGVENEFPPLHICFKVLERLVDACHRAFTESLHMGVLVSETFPHMFSSLAKSLNHISAFYCRLPEKPDQIRQLLLKTLESAVALMKICLWSLQSTQMFEFFPVVRLANIGIASFAPMFVAIGRVGDPQLLTLLEAVLIVSIQCGIESVKSIPELAAPSTIGFTQYGIRGAMCSPGGEDHVGCLVLARLAVEEDSLTKLFVKLIHPYAEQLCELHQYLKQLEITRGRGIVHGVGVRPKSRRLIIQVLCRIHLFAENTARTSVLLEDLFQKSIGVMGSWRDSTSDRPYLLLSDALLDLASFSPSIISGVFGAEDNNSQDMVCLRGLVDACASGYDPSAHASEESVLDWNCLRGAVHEFLLVASQHRKNSRAAGVIIDLMKAESYAIIQLCSLGPSAHTPIFQDRIISQDGIPSGIFIITVREILLNTEQDAIREQCVGILSEMSPFVLQAILHDCPEADSFEDPRPCLLEAWLLTLTCEMDKSLLHLDTCGAICVLICGKSIGLTREDRQLDRHMSFDGPQSLALMDYFLHISRLGILSELGPHLEKALSVADGVGLFSGVLFRCFQGALPPYIIERLSEFYQGLSESSLLSAAVFREFLHRGMTVEWHSKSVAGTLGRLPNFLDEATEAYERHDFRRVKTLVKQLCGGKKHGSDFGTKPTPTRWSNVL